MNKLTLNVFLALIDETAGSLVHVPDPGARAAMGSLYEMRLLLIAEGMINNGDEQLALPPMRDPATGEPKVMRVKTAQVACPLCGAKPGQGCFRMSGRGPHCVPTTEPLNYQGKRAFHEKRTQLAKARSV